MRSTRQVQQHTGKRSVPAGQSRLREMAAALALAVATAAAAPVQAQQSAVRIACEGEAVGATVTVNGRLVGNCPVDAAVPAGNVVIRAVKRTGPETERAFEQEFMLGVGAAKRVEVVLGAERPNEAAASRERQATAALQSRAETGDAAAMMELSRHLSTSKLAEDGKARSFQWLQRAAEAGNVEALTTLASEYEKGSPRLAKDLAASVRLLKLAAQAGDVSSMANYGKARLVGEGGPKDLEEAKTWFTRAADHGNGRGLNGLGIMYYTGTGVPADPAKAADYFEKAEAAGFATSSYWLMHVYRDGKGRLADAAKSVRYALACAEATREPACVVPAANALLWGADVPKDTRRGLEMLHTAAKTGSVDAISMLVVVYENGIGTPKDLGTAQYWKDQLVAAMRR